ncbi:MAG: hypothetical protein J0M09_14370 [Xanthomonadales bacterium]|nr:hypothetical protein [Xanthomonadales bacterium]
MKITSRKLLLVCTLSATAVTGSAAALEKWVNNNYSIDYFDASGNLVGQEGYDCYIGRYRWGDTTLESVYWDYGTCP